MDEDQDLDDSISGYLGITSMVKAVKGMNIGPFNLPNAACANSDYPLGVLIECDPSIKAIILKIDSESHEYIVEDLDDYALVIKESQLPRLKDKLEEVGLAVLLRKMEEGLPNGVGSC